MCTHVVEVWKPSAPFGSPRYPPSIYVHYFAYDYMATKEGGKCHLVLRWQFHKHTLQLTRHTNVSVIPKPHVWCTRNVIIFSSSLLTPPVTYVCVFATKLYPRVYSWNTFRDPFLDKDEWLDPHPQHMVQTRPPAGWDRPCLWKGNF